MRHDGNRHAIICILGQPPSEKNIESEIVSRQSGGVLFALFNRQRVPLGDTFRGRGRRSKPASVVRELTCKNLRDTPQVQSLLPCPYGRQGFHSTGFCRRIEGAQYTGDQARYQAYEDQSCKELIVWP